MIGRSDFQTIKRRAYTKMSEKCNDISQNITKLNYPGENLGFTTEIDGRENKEDFLNFPFDHMYACNSDNSDLNSERQAGESEVRHLKDLLLLHLDLIQQQSDEIVSKDKFIVQLRQENEMLKQRLDRMERRITVPQNIKNNSHLHNSNNSFSLDSFSDNMTHDTGFCADTEDSKDNLKVMGLCNEDSEFNLVVPTIARRSADRGDGESGTDSMGPSDRCFTNRRHKINSATASTIKEHLIKSEDNKLEMQTTPDTYPDSTTVGNSVRNTHLELHSNHVNRGLQETRQFTLRPSSRRKRLCSSSSQLSNNESLASVSDDRKSGTHRKRRKGALNRVHILTTDSPYIIQTGALSCSLTEEQGEILDVNHSTNLEVPRWRVKVYSSCYSMEGTENLDDDVFNRRHLRLENDERRRKRWDVQRIREQRHIERLKQRQERQGSKSDEQSEPLSSFWPSLEDIQYIEVGEELPISAFGTPIPKLTPSEFRLPWLNGLVQVKKTPNRKSKTRRKSLKR